MNAWNWNDGWVSGGEGPLSILAKFQTANVFNSEELCRHLFEKRCASETRRSNRHTRSLVHLDWFSELPTNDPFVKLTTSRSLHQLCGIWCSRLAKDQQIRLCLRCLDEGFLPACLQICGISHCPAHQLELTKKCPHCGAPTAPYAINRGTFSPLTCSNCERPYSLRWAQYERCLGWPRCPIDPRINQLHTWFKSILGCRLEWPDFSAWQIDPESHSGTEAHAVAVFEVLRKTVPGCPELPSPAVISAQLSVCKMQSTELRDLDSNQQVRVDSYIRIRANLREWSELRGGDSFTYSDSLEDYEGIRTPGDCSHHPAWHAFHLWRFRFETARPKNALDWYHKPVALRDFMLHWPGICGVTKDAWLDFALACWRADLATASGWYYTLQTASSLPIADYHQHVFEKYDRWRAFLCPPVREWPPKVSSLLAQHSDGSKGFWLVS